MPPSSGPTPPGNRSRGAQAAARQTQLLETTLSCLVELGPDRRVAQDVPWASSGGAGLVEINGGDKRGDT
ncbi:MAG TPA: hypothetical protein VFE65_04690 [Pseudonocardia sp.]|nr:hypothetical protein [Pseudonocardia sp.]